MQNFKFWMTGVAMTLVAALSGCGGGSSDVGDGGGHVPPTLSATLPTAATATAPVSITGITVTNGAALTVDWGDGTQDAPAAIPTSLTHTYASTATCVKAGTCNIDLAVLGWGTAAELKGAVVVSPAPTLAATLPTTGTVSVPVSISGIAAANGTALSVDWGDGTKETPATSATSLTHTYAGAGSYAIDLVLSGANGTKAETKGSVTINAIAQPVLAATLPTTGVAGTAVNITGVSTTNGTALSVDWGDGTTLDTPALSATTLSHTYAAAGSYTIKMVLTGSAASTPDNKTTGTVTITTSAPPLHLVFAGSDMQMGATMYSSFGLVNAAYATGVDHNGVTTQMLHLTGTATANGYFFTSAANANSKGSFTKIVIWMKGTATGKGVSINYAGPGSGGHYFNLGTLDATAAATTLFAPATTNSYTGSVTLTDWTKVTLDISSLADTAITAYPFSMKFGTSGVYDVWIGDIEYQ